MAERMRRWYGRKRLRSRAQNSSGRRNRRLMRSRKALSGDPGAVGGPRAQRRASVDCRCGVGCILSGTLRVGLRRDSRKLGGDGSAVCGGRTPASRPARTRGRELRGAASSRGHFFGAVENGASLLSQAQRLFFARPLEAACFGAPVWRCGEEGAAAVSAVGS